MTNPNKNIFTLIELLIVISIIAILAALLLPALARTKIRGQAVSCRNVLSQIGTASLMYANDFNDLAPGSGYGSSSSQWMDQIHPDYTGVTKHSSWKQKDKLRCDDIAGWYYDAYKKSEPGNMVRNFAINYYARGCKLSRVKNTSEMGFFIDGMIYVGSNSLHWDRLASSNADFYLDIHEKRLNSVWIDGHVGFFTNTEVLTFSLRDKWFNR